MRRQQRQHGHGGTTGGIGGIIIGVLYALTAYGFIVGRFMLRIPPLAGFI